MNDPESWAISYLAARGDSAWRWADDGDVIAWADGTTIAFREEVASILEWMVPHGWPPFGALVWLLAATRGKLPPRVSFERRFVIPPHPHPAMEDPAQPTLALFQERLRSMYDVVEEGLAAISRLPEEQRTSLKAKAVLAEKIFGSLGHQQPAFLVDVIEVLRSGLLTDAMLNDPGSAPVEPRNEWLALHEGLKDFSADSLELRAKTGLDEVPEPADLPAIASVRVRALLEQLRTDSEHAGLARLARDFMAALQLPRRLSEPDEMPIGGFADLSNRGNLDRLLLSELAHDDLTLAVRIALNEALYLRREPPAKQPPSTLAVLIDSGVRLWGVPRVLASAIALALVAKSGRQEAPAVFRASGATISPVDLLTRPGLIAHLGALEPQAHPGQALDPFRKYVQTQERAEAVLITHRDVLHDAEFQRSLALADFEMLYLAVVDREGSFELLRHPRGGAPVCQARMNVDDLWPSPAAAAPRRQPLIDRAANPELPVSFSCEPFSLLLAVRGKAQAVVRTGGGGGVCVMQDRRLLQWEPTNGARTLAWSLPRGQTLRLEELSDERICVIKAHRGGREVSCRVFTPAGELVHADDWRFAESVRHAEVRDNVAIVASARNAWVRSLATGEQLAHLGFPSRMTTFSGRYLCSLGSNWSTLMWDGLRLRLEPLTFIQTDPSSHGVILQVFDRRGLEGAWWLTMGGGVFSPEGKCVLSLGGLYPDVEVSEDGHRLVVVQNPGRDRRMVDLQTLSHHEIGTTLSREVWDWRISRPRLPSQSVRVRFDQIAIDEDASLHLRKPGGVWRTVFLTEVGFKLVLGAVPGTLNAVPFKPLRMPGHHGFSLKVAHWPDGRCAWLDDRGMLHLRCADRSLPELTIVLSETLAMWSSDALWTGPEFFLGNRQSSDPALFLERIRNFCRPAPLFPGIEA